MPTWARAAVLIGLLANSACTAILGLSDKPEAADASSDAPRASTDAPSTSCTADDAGYHDPASLACWELFQVTEAFDPNPDYEGGAFDGRYVYFVSSYDGHVVRYDTQGTFSGEGSWSQYETMNLQDGNQEPYEGAVFDGRYVYFIPFGGSAMFLRYDTTASFDGQDSWSSYQPNMDGIDYAGGTFDGRYVYFAPYEDQALDPSGAVLRYDTKGSFTTAASWTKFDTAALGSGDLQGAATAFRGAAFDGRYVYFVPSGSESNVTARYDTKATFDVGASWEVFDTGNVNSQVEGYTGAVFDGAYIYLVPQYESAPVLQLDITKPFGSTSAWKAYAAAPGSGMIGGADSPNFAGGAYDGRFLYFVPGANGDGTLNGLLARHDDGISSFTAPGSWSTFDATKKLKVGDFGSSVYDGRYLYFAPGLYSAFARFDTKDTTLQPKLPAYFGSFF
jgi:hypothetical protein